MTQKAWYPVAYMFIVTAFFSSLLIGFAFSTRQRVEANEQIAFERAVLQSVQRAQDLKTQQVHQRFTDLMQGPAQDGSFTLVEDGKTKGYALPFAGKGFWAPILGVIGFEADRKTVKAIAFYEQNETPGLGGKIVEQEWRQRFDGLVLAEQGKPIEITKFPAEQAKNQVQAITGATQTMDRLEYLVNEDIQDWKSKQSRSGDS